MCRCSKKGELLVQRIVKEVYPAIDHQLLVVTWKGNFLPEEKSTAYDKTLSDLKAEFNSLKTYEYKLVFPSVLRLFDSGGLKTNEANRPNIGELIALTQHKEKRLIELAEALGEYAAQIQQQPLADLATLFTEDFRKQKEAWNEMIAERLGSCACFKVLERPTTTVKYETDSLSDRLLGVHR